jgi:hypothetical protein
MRFKYFSFYAILFLFVNLAFGQSTKFLKSLSDQRLYDEAMDLYDEGNYVMAIKPFKKLEKKYPTQELILFRVGVCQLYNYDGRDKALEYLEKVDLKKFKKTDILYQLAVAKHLNNKLDESEKFCEEFLKTKPSSKEKKSTEKLLEYIANARTLEKDVKPYTINNLGPNINSIYNDYSPIVTADESMILYTYAGEKSKGGLQLYPSVKDANGFFFEDIFFTKKDSVNNWKTAAAFDNLINTEAHDAAISITNEAKRLFIYNTEKNGNFWEYVNEKGKWINKKSLKGDVNSDSWEGSMTLSADVTKIIFSSERSGGFGGRDLYEATLKENGTWGDVKNLGENINTKDDEDAPSLHPSGKILIFSSKGHNSMGGYDNFYSELDLASNWSTPQNLGVPINTTDDDKYFSITTNGKRGYFSSARPGGIGKQDLYSVDGLNFSNINLILLAGNTTSNGEPVPAQIEVVGDNGKINIYNSNPIDGKYVVILPAGANYSITYKAEKMSSKNMVIEAKDLKEYKESISDVDFAKELTVPENLRITTVAAVTDSLNKSTESTATAAKTETVPVTKQEVLEKALVINYGETRYDDVLFKVQLAAYKEPGKAQKSYLKQFGALDKETLEDGITRYIVKEKFYKLNDARNKKTLLLNAGAKNALIIAYYKGKRYYLTQLWDLGIFK